MTPEMRREQEARMLAQEEARVAAAQAEYRQRVAQRGSAPAPLPKSIGGVSRAVSIQNKVQSLLDESSRSTTNVSRTAQGYGQYSDAAYTTVQPSTSDDNKPYVPRKPASITGQAASTQRPPTSSGVVPAERTSTANLPGGSRPAAPPKPGHLNRNLTNGVVPQRPPSPTKPSTGINPTKMRGGSGSVSAGSEALLAVDLPGGGGSALLHMTASEKDDYIRDFQKRFPSLGAIEMVERDLSAEGEYAAERPGTGTGTRP